jgi:type IV pilus assembly protein PilB
MAVKRIEDLGMKPRDRDLILEELKKPDGMILNTGPTGSGKTTTLAALLQFINKPELKIITLEDPIEYRIPGIEQTQVDEESGYTFSRGLRSILRQDPDIILVGEIRDTDTAETAMHAALTGHLVLTTLHTNDAVGAIPRLVDMGVRPYIIAPAVNAVIAQRLVRKVCPHCREEYRATSEERALIREATSGMAKEVFDQKALDDPKLTLVRAKGCPKCNDTGYRGRIGVFEIFAVKGEMEKLTTEGADTLALKEAAHQQGMTTVTQDAMLKVLEKITTLEEAARVGEV